MMTPTCERASLRQREPGNEWVDALLNELAEEFEAPCRLFDGATGALLGSHGHRDTPGTPQAPSRDQIVASSTSGRPRVLPLGFDHNRLILPFTSPDRPAAVVVVDLTALARTAEDASRERSRIYKWAVSAQHRLSAGSPPQASKTEDEPLSLTLRGILELGELLRCLQSLSVPNPDSNLILSRAIAVLPVQTLIWVPQQHHEPVAIEGTHRLLPVDCRKLADLVTACPGRDSSGCLIINHAAATSIGAHYPGITNVLALAIDDSHTGGRLIALNKLDTRFESRELTPNGHLATAPFRRLDSALLVPFAAILGVQACSSHRQAQVRELITGLTRSLIAVIDARDLRTFGHSERVARVAVELGREMGLSDDELNDIYLGGLIHDIGTVGVSDKILDKTDPLTPFDIEEIRQHVVIGFRILADFRAIAHVLPQVLYHHERYDGTGYPEGLKSDEIPLPARILAVADSFDAMSSPRPYRAALSREKIEETLRQGSGQQWDGNVVDAFFRARERIYTMRLSGVGESVCLPLESAVRLQRADRQTTTHRP